MTHIAVLRLTHNNQRHKLGNFWTTLHMQSDIYHDRTNVLATHLEILLFTPLIGIGTPNNRVYNFWLLDLST